jgi:hypothetical protein
MSSPNEIEPQNDVWTTKSKKEMVLGIALMSAGIGCEPMGGGSFLWLSLLAIVCGLYLVILGFFHE